LAIGVGSVGQHLAVKTSEFNVFLTRDGGHNWFEIRNGSHVFKIGNRGDLLVMARDDVLTN
jgi:Sortilin, neurotensin receptor 3,